ncbi:MAG: type IV secretory system conjugative DNA transfer family protein [Verrucomicrobiota bacterium]
MRFSRKPPVEEELPPEPLVPDLLGDFPRGVEGRSFDESRLTKGYFETPERLREIGFQDFSGHNFIGVVDGIIDEHGQTQEGVPIGISDNRHRCIVAGSRSGKGTSSIVPGLLTNIASTVVLDPKGENAAITASYREKVMNHDVFIVDPFCITPKSIAHLRKQFNPLEQIMDRDNPHFVEDAGLIADALVIASGDGKGQHFDDTARAFIEALILFVAVGEFEDERNLRTVYQLASCQRHESFDLLLEKMIDLDKEVGGRIAAGAIAMRDRGPDERGSVISTVRRHLKFLDYDAFEYALVDNHFSLLDLKEKPMTVYLVLPAMRMSSCRGFLRLFVNLTLAAAERNKTNPDHPVELVLDEIALLGHMKELETAIGLVAGLGLRITTIWQDLGQAKALFRDRWETFIGNSGVTEFFGVADYFTSEWVSKYLGKTTLRIAEHTATSYEQSLQGTPSQQIRQQSEDLMTPAEVRHFFSRNDRLNRKLVLIPGKRPWVVQRANYFSHSLFQGRFKPRE